MTEKEKERGKEDHVSIRQTRMQVRGGSRIYLWVGSKGKDR